MNPAQFDVVVVSESSLNPGIEFSFSVNDQSDGISLVIDEDSVLLVPDDGDLASDVLNGFLSEDRNGDPDVSSNSNSLSADESISVSLKFSEESEVVVLKLQYGSVINSLKLNEFASEFSSSSFFGILNFDDKSVPDI